MIHSCSICRQSCCFYFTS